jgi:hypothetical protein
MDLDLRMKVTLTDWFERLEIALGRAHDRQNLPTRIVYRLCPYFIIVLGIVDIAVWSVSG